jgi:predicted metal-binding protein
MVTRLPFQDADPSHLDFQYIEDLSTAYWYSEILFAALDIRLFDFLGRDGKDIGSLRKAMGGDASALARLLIALERIGLVEKSNGTWFNSQATARYLMESSPDYMGACFLYRRYMQKEWQGLAGKLFPGKIVSEKREEKDDYSSRNFRYVCAMDALSRQKALEIGSLLKARSWRPPILDIGGGAGALIRALIEQNDSANGFLLELPEVVAAARRRYPDEASWDRIGCLEGDFRSLGFSSSQRYGLILMGNFLHAYSAAEAHPLLLKARELLLPGGVLVIHDYFPDRAIGFPHKGALYDLAMMLNTYNGSCHSCAQVLDWLMNAGLTSIETVDLSTDSSLIIAREKAPDVVETAESPDWLYLAREIGFRTAVWLSPDRVVTAPWARMKCRFGCAGYGKNSQCPPNGLSLEDTLAMLGAYQKALLVEDAPPGKAFHEKLLRLEKRAFLSGFHKAFVLGAGPCPVCTTCPPDGTCRSRELARPSMEGSGIDVYETARNAGLRLMPLTQKDQYVKYFGLLLLE